jgi:hypothetical protein
MKSLVLFSLVLLVISTEIIAQQDTIQSQFKSLQLNSSPAYSILGVEPENIQRPNSPSDFVAGVQSAMVNGILQPNFALETTPYYWGKPKDQGTKFNALDFITNDNYWENIAKSMTFSLASSPTDTFTFGNIPRGTGLGLGLHMQLVQGKISKNVRDNLLDYYYSSRTQVILDQTISKLESGKSVDDFEYWIDERFENEPSLKNIPENEKNSMKALLLKKIRKTTLSPGDLSLIKKVRDEFDKKSQNALRNTNEYQFPLTREGFMLEFAIANARIISHNNWDSINNAKTSIWFTPSYRFNVGQNPTLIDIIDVMAVGRLTFNNDAVDSSDYIDFGGKLQWIHNKISFSGELIYRFNTGKPENQIKNYTYKTGLTFSYKLNDLVTFKTTFGSNFNGNSTMYDDPQSLMVIGGVNFGINGFSSNGKNQ